MSDSKLIILDNDINTIEIPIHNIIHDDSQVIFGVEPKYILDLARYHFKTEFHTTIGNYKFDFKIKNDVKEVYNKYVGAFVKDIEFSEPISKLLDLEVMAVHIVFDKYIEC